VKKTISNAFNKIFGKYYQSRCPVFNRPGVTPMPRRLEPQLLWNATILVALKMPAKAGTPNALSF
ncbi:MAG: hypothetical protein WCP55_07915, partial [Lentisphaerota bacterium]